MIIIFIIVITGINLPLESPIRIHCIKIIVCCFKVNSSIGRNCRRRIKDPGYDKDVKKKLVTLVDKGGIVKGAFKDRKCVGLLTAGSYELFPKLESFKVFPPDPKSTFLGCIYIEPEGKGRGIKKRLRY